MLFLAIFLPPVYFLLRGRLFSAVFSILVYPLSIIWAVLDNFDSNK